MVDFRSIRQPWLREFTKRFAREVRPPVTVLRQVVHAAEIASQQLALRTNGDRPELLNTGDMSEVVEGFHSSADRDGIVHSVSHRRAMLGVWHRMIEHSRRSGAMDAIHGGFAIDPRFHFIALIDTREDDLGRVIPEHVIAQLDANTALLGAFSSYAIPGWSAADFARMYQTVYKILRDTGRRPSEVCSLKRTCMEWVDGKPTLIYDNRKRRRMGRRLPIHLDTVQVIQDWLDYVDRLPVPETLREWMFPIPGGRNNLRRGHLTAHQFGSRAFALWIDQIPDIVDQRLDETGDPLPYDRALITAYGLRHSYAQRHADNGTPVDVLCQLMDHRSIETTMGYYSVSLRRKREATEKVGAFMIDRCGHPAGFASVGDYERQSVARPVRQLHRAVQHQGRRPALPDPIPMRRLLVLSPRPVLPPGDRTAYRPAAHRQGTRPGHRRRGLGDRQLRRPDHRLRRGGHGNDRDARRAASRPAPHHRGRLPRTPQCPPSCHVHPRHRGHQQKGHQR
ncbi:site-specific integrase [Nocardia sp. CA2R105]|uniref:site-specific integrase n=1 Tax=Nocardia coffeae TaxID=2873381 RepID=UPI001CA6B92C|nr:site-specific integrase [Nocardia coffeae]MBY8861227.1 site-specific integrase [Nocardia coffeae]